MGNRSWSWTGNTDTVQYCELDILSTSTTQNHLVYKNHRDDFCAVQVLCARKCSLLMDILLLAHGHNPGMHKEVPARACTLKSPSGVERATRAPMYHVRNPCSPKKAGGGWEAGDAGASSHSHSRLQWWTVCIIGTGKHASRIIAKSNGCREVQDLLVPTRATSSRTSFVPCRVVSPAQSCTA